MVPVAGAGYGTVPVAEAGYLHTYGTSSRGGLRYHWQRRGMVGTIPVAEARYGTCGKNGWVRTVWYQF